MEETINQRFKMCRKAMGISVAEFAKKIGLAQSSVFSIESGDRAVNERNIKLLETYCHVNPEYLRTGAEPMFKESDDEYINRLADEKSLSPLARAVMREFAKLDENIQEAMLQGIIKMVENVKNVDMRDQIGSVIREHNAEPDSKSTAE